MDLPELLERCGLSVDVVPNSCSPWPLLIVVEPIHTQADRASLSESTVGFQRLLLMEIGTRLNAVQTLELLLRHSSADLRVPKPWHVELLDRRYLRLLDHRVLSHCESLGSFKVSTHQVEVIRWPWHIMWNRLDSVHFLLQLCMLNVLLSREIGGYFLAVHSVAHVMQHTTQVFLPVGFD